MTQLQIALAVLCGLTAVVVVVQIIRDRLANRLVHALLAIIELGLVVQLVLGLMKVFDGHEGVSVATYVGYLLGSLVILPLAAGWSWAERSRSGTAVLLVGLFVVPFLFVRLHDIWSLHA
ncbi:MAG TPA: hypothetical protein VFO98_03060 [Marmoricola sp.]|nr:hypothetical protein [Marmoricola sp.]